MNKFIANLVLFLAIVPCANLLNAAAVGKSRKNKVQHFKDGFDALKYIHTHEINDPVDNVFMLDGRAFNELTFYARASVDKFPEQVTEVVDRIKNKKVGLNKLPEIEIGGKKIQGYSALVHAVHLKHKNIAQLLLDAKADPNLHVPFGDSTLSPLEFAMMPSHDSIPCLPLVELLLKCPNFIVTESHVLNAKTLPTPERLPILASITKRYIDQQEEQQKKRAAKNSTLKTRKKENKARRQAEQARLENERIEQERRELKRFEEVYADLMREGGMPFEASSFELDPRPITEITGLSQAQLDELRVTAQAEQAKRLADSGKK